MRIVNMTGAAALLFGAALLTACQGRPMASSDAPVTIYRSAQALQCEPESGVSLAQAEAELAHAGVAGRCGQVGDDGAMRIQLCGADSGRIHLFRIAASDLTAAQALGYQPANTLASVPASYCDQVTEPAAAEDVTL